MDNWSAVGHIGFPDGVATDEILTKTEAVVLRHYGSIEAMNEDLPCTHIMVFGEHVMVDGDLTATALRLLSEVCEIVTELAE